MNNETANVPEKIRQEAKARALAIITAEKGCISYVKPEDLETQSLFIPIVSVIKPIPGDFHDNIPNIGILPKVPLMNLMREKAGVHITRTDTSKRGEYIWIAHSFGERRQPDGTMATDDSSYEFDAEKRAELDFINDSKNKYTTDILKRKHVLELCKFAEQRAVTGAQLALIHKLAKLPASFKTPEELMRGMIVVRYDRNVNGIMQDPNMRGAIIQHALGATETVFGPQTRQIEAQPATTPEAQAEPEQGAGDGGKDPLDTFTDDIPWDEKPEDIARRHLSNFLDMPDPRLKNSAGWKVACELIRAMVNDKDANLQGMNDLIKRTEGWLTKNKVTLPTNEKKAGEV
jgi:hypothetical protein